MRAARLLHARLLVLVLGPSATLLAAPLWTTRVAAAQSAPKSQSSPKDPSSSSSARANVVEIAVIGTAADLQRIRALVEPRPLGGSAPAWVRVGRFDPLEILQADRQRPSAAPLRCWVDISDPRRARLYFAARSGQQFLVRDVELSGTFDEVDRESLSQVLELSVTALLENERAGLTRAQTEALLLSSRRPGAPPALTAVPPPPSHPTTPRPELTSPPTRDQGRTSTTLQQQSSGPPTRWRSSIGIWYGARIPGGGLPIGHGPGVVLTHGKVRDRLALAGWITGQYQVPGRQEAPAVSIGLETVAFRGGPELRWTAAAYQLTGRLGIGADLVRVEPQSGSVDRSATLTRPRWTQNLVFTMAAGVQRAVGAHILVGVLAFLDLLPTAVHYDLQVSGTAAEVFSPARIRPGLALQLLIR